MILYNVTVKVDHSVATEWIKWLHEEHIPDMIGTGCFTNASVLKLLEIDDSEGPTFAIQYFAESKSLYNLYIDKHAVIMREKGFQKWGNKFIAFRSVMQFVN